MFVVVPSVEILRKGPTIDGQEVPPKKLDPLLLWKIEISLSCFVLVWSSLFWPQRPKAPECWW